MSVPWSLKVLISMSEKILERLSRGKNKFISEFSSAPQIINGRPLTFRSDWAHLCKCTVGSYASLCVRLSVRLSVTGPKFRLDNNSYLVKFARYQHETLQQFLGMSPICNPMKTFESVLFWHTTFILIIWLWHWQVGSLQCQVASF